jgi:osmotically-inducible protein OsmY
MDHTLLPKFLSEKALEKHVRRRLENDRLLDATRVSVSADDGVVHLKGTVPDDCSRALALYDALQVDGVRRVVNDLTPEP